MLDPLRITVAVTKLGLTGFQVGAMLEQQHEVVMELATQQVSLLQMHMSLKILCQHPFSVAKHTWVCCRIV